MLSQLPLSQKAPVPQTTRHTLYCCYGLRSLNPQFPKAVYVGFTNNPLRRIRQHNGEIKNGARKTHRYRPWDMAVCVHGFPSHYAALQFEWAWQNPRKSRVLKSKLTSQIKFSRGFNGLLQIVNLLLSSRPFKLMPLSVLCTSEDVFELAKNYITAHPHIDISLGSLDTLPCYGELRRKNTSSSQEYGTGNMESNMENICLTDGDLPPYAVDYDDLSQNSQDDWELDDDLDTHSHARDVGAHDKTYDDDDSWAFGMLGGDEDIYTQQSQLDMSPSLTSIGTIPTGTHATSIPADATSLILNAERQDGYTIDSCSDDGDTGSGNDNGANVGINGKDYSRNSKVSIFSQSRTPIFSQSGTSVNSQSDGFSSPLRVRPYPALRPSDSRTGDCQTTSEIGKYTENYDPISFLPSKSYLASFSYSSSSSSSSSSLSSSVCSSLSSMPSVTPITCGICTTNGHRTHTNTSIYTIDSDNNTNTNMDTESNTNRDSLNMGVEDDNYDSSNDDNICTMDTNKPLSKRVRNLRFGFREINPPGIPKSFQIPDFDFPEINQPITSHNSPMPCSPSQTSTKVLSSTSGFPSIPTTNVSDELSRKDIFPNSVSFPTNRPYSRDPMPYMSYVWCYHCNFPFHLHCLTTLFHETTMKYEILRRVGNADAISGKGVGNLPYDDMDDDGDATRKAIKKAGKQPRNLSKKGSILIDELHSSDEDIILPKKQKRSRKNQKATDVGRKQAASHASPISLVQLFTSPAAIGKSGVFQENNHSHVITPTAISKQYTNISGNMPDSSSVQAEDPSVHIQASLVNGVNGDAQFVEVPDALADILRSEPLLSLASSLLPIAGACVSCHGVLSWPKVLIYAEERYRALKDEELLKERVDREQEKDRKRQQRNKEQEKKRREVEQLRRSRLREKEQEKERRNYDKDRESDKSGKSPYTRKINQKGPSLFDVDTYEGKKGIDGIIPQGDSTTSASIPSHPLDTSENDFEWDNWSFSQSDGDVDAILDDNTVTSNGNNYNDHGNSVVDEYHNPHVTSLDEDTVADIVEATVADAIDAGSNTYTHSLFERIQKKRQHSPMSTEVGTGMGTMGGSTSVDQNRGINMDEGAGMGTRTEVCLGISSDIDAHQTKGNRNKIEISSVLLSLREKNNKKRMEGNLGGAKEIRTPGSSSKSKIPKSGKDNSRRLNRPEVVALARTHHDNAQYRALYDNILDNDVHYIDAHIQHAYANTSALLTPGREERNASSVGKSGVYHENSGNSPKTSTATTPCTHTFVDEFDFDDEDVSHSLMSQIDRLPTNHHEPNSRTKPKEQNGKNLQIRRFGSDFRIDNLHSWR